MYKGCPLLMEVHQADLILYRRWSHHVSLQVAGDQFVLAGLWHNCKAQIMAQMSHKMT